jgi:hypothetical protein
MTNPEAPGGRALPEKITRYGGRLPLQAGRA